MFFGKTTKFIGHGIPKLVLIENLAREIMMVGSLVKKNEKYWKEESLDFILKEEGRTRVRCFFGLESEFLLKFFFLRKLFDKGSI